MARRRNREVDIAFGIAKLAGLMVFVPLFVPSTRQIFISVGLFLVGAVVLGIIVALGVVFVRRGERKPSYASMQFAKVEALPPPRPSYSSAKQPEHKPAPPPDLIQQLRELDWFQFEKLVALLYHKRGYTVTRRGGANPDGGIDLVLEKDGQRSAVQCKQWKTWNVGVKAVREFLGALTDADMSKGIFITLCGYSCEAKQLAEKHGIEIVNETSLARMLESANARFDPETLAILRDTRKFCAKCESEMVLRTARRGSGAGKQFWGCSTYPRCRFTMQT